jgi:hypothetical protein
VNEDGYLTGPPELVVEVSTSSRRFDLGAKRADYERAGVQEYLVVALDPDEAFGHVNTGGGLVRIAADPDGIYRSRVLHGLWLDPVALWAGELDALIAALDRGLASVEHERFVARLAAAGRRRRVAHDGGGSVWISDLHQPTEPPGGVGPGGGVAGLVEGDGKRPGDHGA